MAQKTLKKHLQETLKKRLNDMSDDHVRQVVNDCEETDVIDHLYSFGLMLTAEIGQRSDRIESKANLVVGWSTAILAFLVTQLGKLTASRHALQLIAIGIALLAMSALWCAFLALKSRSDWIWPSDKDWFCESEVGSSERIKKFHLQCLHGVRQTHQRITQKKGRMLRYSEWFLLTAALLLTLEVVLSLASSLGFGF